MIRELTGALQHSILHQTSTDLTGLDHGPIETLAGPGNAPTWYLESTSLSPTLRAHRRHAKVIIRHFAYGWDVPFAS
jgi:hypothetical protein